MKGHSLQLFLLPDSPYATSGFSALKESRLIPKERGSISDTRAIRDEMGNNIGPYGGYSTQRIVV